MEGLEQTAWARSISDFGHTLRTLRFGFVLTMLGIGAPVVAIYFFTPDSASPAREVSTAAVAVATAIAGGLITVLIWFLFRAPYRQRNEAREAITNKTPSPLEVVCNSWKRTLVGDDVIRGHEYIWEMSTTLTNTSDTLHVSTNRVALRVNHALPDGVTRTFGLSLMSPADHDRVGSDGGRILNENEYLGPRDSRTGAYYFLGNDMHGMLPMGRNTWPNLVVTDSFGSHHNTNFPSARIATPLTPDTEDSPSEEGE